MTKTLSMRAVVFQGVGKISVEQRPRPQIQDQRDVILKVCVAALCGSDLHWYRGHQTIPTGFIPGHEFVGTVHELGSEVKGFSRGDVVVATFSTQCGNCFYCRRQQTSRCASSFLFGNSGGTTSIDGGQAEYVRVPYATSTLVHAPSSIPQNLLVLMADIFPTGYFCATRFLKQLSPDEVKSSVMAVVGCGPVGICAIATALTQCDTVFAIDMVPERLIEAERLGARPLLLTDNPAEAIKGVTDGRGADIVLEVVGTLDAMRLCINLVRPFGSISSVGVQTEQIALEGPVLYGKNVTIAWGRCPVRGIFEDALECLGKVQAQVAFLCDRSMKFEQAAEAYQLFNDRKVHKLLLKP
ncbi:chaperonin 10-like protein [Penicillium canescens]|nr:chaperonin 10-like protein [Penicillium canescens]